MSSSLFGRISSSLGLFPMPACTIFNSRLFSSSPVVEAGYKMKSHSGTKKRWRSLASGSSFKRGQAGHAHLNVHKSSSRKNRLAQTAHSVPYQTHKLKKLLLPYGSH